MTIDTNDLDRLRTLGDAEADRDLADIWRQLSPQQQADLVKTLGRWDPSRPGLGPPLPAPVREYVERRTELPPWADVQAVRRAQEAYGNELRPAERVVLAAYSLPILYIHPEISLTLATTGQLLQHVRRRLEDTQGFVDAVMVPGSLAPGATGQQWIRKVRLTHAVIRMMRLRDEPRTRALLPNLERLWLDQDVAAQFRLRTAGRVEDPMPLDQLEMALVLQTFAWVLVEGLRKMGWAMTRAQAADHVHAWSVVGFLLGIDPSVLPRGRTAVRESEELFVALRERLLARGDPLEREPSDRADTWLSGRLLTAAWITMLVQLQREQTPQRLKPLLTRWHRLDEALQPVPRMLIRRLCGNEAARILRVGHVGGFDWIVCWLALKLFDLRQIATEMEGAADPVLAGALV